MVHVHDKVIPVCCGSGSQRIQWLGHVGIARYDDTNNQGWLQFGIAPSPRARRLFMFMGASCVVGKPVAVRNAKGAALGMTDIVCEVLSDKEHIYIDTSRVP
ncbi:Aste57867_5962 [Aphanomyces stellatus]|uniref:Aste57867_5962 protein n=1 Tax=Aphanomyces stellatus TaxID=120398 RepID=A0A485KDN4_9STRA|nr:hypothetical protein As57867_005948 [Aphanomyces stellatus]VFT82979.1 Aste57867_5962 [Aphanomyces stellatus]